MALSDYIEEIYLVSQSPARLEVLQKQGVKVYAFPQFCDEKTNETEPGKTVESLSLKKLRSFMNSKDFGKNITAVACDTLLFFEGRMIGKAHSEDEARNQISSLAGKTHYVYSGYALYRKGKIYSGYDCAKVKFKEIEDEKLEQYIKSNEWKGAAGSYHIFGKAVDFIESYEGDVNTIIGFPLKKVENLLKMADDRV